MDAVVSLFDYTGVMVKPWIEGDSCQAFIFDIQHPDVSIEQQLSEGANPVKVTGDYTTWDSTIEYINNNYNIEILFSFPPCTDLAVSGASHFARKLEQDPLYKDKAMAMVYAGKRIADLYGLPFMIENPVSVISTTWRKPDYTFHPYEYGGYLDKDDIPPYDLIPARDRYTKKTCLWTGGNFVMPTKDPVSLPTGYRYSPQHNKLGGKSLKTKNIRSATPRGFAKAVWESNTNPPLWWD